MKDPVIGVLLDGVLAYYDKNRGVLEIARPIDGAPAFCKWLREELKCVVIVLTGRRREDLVEKWLKDNKIPYSAVNMTVGDPSIEQCTNKWVICDYYLLPKSRGGIFTGSYAACFKEVAAQMAVVRERHKRIETRDW